MSTFCKKCIGVVSRVLESYLSELLFLDVLSASRSKCDTCYATRQKAASLVVRGEKSAIFSHIVLLMLNFLFRHAIYQRNGCKFIDSFSNYSNLIVSVDY